MKLKRRFYPLAMIALLLIPMKLVVHALKHSIKDNSETIKERSLREHLRGLFNAEIFHYVIPHAHNLRTSKSPGKHHSRTSVILYYYKKTDIRSLKPTQKKTSKKQLRAFI